MYFVDTNVFVYTRDASEPGKQPLAAAWVEYLWRSRNGRLSSQVLQEYYQAVTRKLSPGLTTEAARQDVRDLFAWQPVMIDSAIVERAWSVEDRYQLSWWDSLIVGAALHAECRYLLTEDLQQGQEFGTVTVVNPFSAEIPRT